ncbi:MAG: hypothetical protein F4145_14575 [Boseongicola sp. SB0675_bin_26]|nr:hypothetical protein [Boseongicola sp. SB0675_bin_26]
MDPLNPAIDSINAFACGPRMLGMTGVLLKSGRGFMSWRRLSDGFRLLFDKETVGKGRISISGSGKVQWCRLSCIGRTGAVQVHPS